MKRRTILLGVLATPVLAVGVLALALRPPRLDVPRPGVTLRHVTVVEPGAGRRPDHTVIVESDRITSVAASAASEPENEYAGHFVLPGLIDLHVHHPPSLALGERDLFGLLFLAHGVTTVRDAGSIVTPIYAHARRIARGKRAGPRIHACGPILDGEPPGWLGARVLTTPEEADPAVARLVREGASCVKIYNSVSAPVYTAIRDAAERRGLPVVAHVPWLLPFDQMGRVEVQHMMGLAQGWVFVPGHLRAEYVASSVAQGITHTPTLVAFARGSQLSSYESLRDEPVGQLLPRHYRELLWNPHLNPLAREMSDTGGSQSGHRIEVMKEVVASLHEAGVRILAGTDTMNPFVAPGAGLQEELGLLVESGLSIDEAWLAATRHAGEALAEAGLGTLDPDAPADLLVFREDPTRDLKALATLEAVVTRGRLYRKKTLDAAVKAQLDHYDGSLYGRLLEWIAHRALDWIENEGC